MNVVSVGYNPNDGATPLRSDNIGGGLFQQAGHDFIGGINKTRRGISRQSKKLEQRVKTNATQLVQATRAGAKTFRQRLDDKKGSGFKKGFSSNRPFPVGPFPGKNGAGVFTGGHFRFNDRVFGGAMSTGGALSTGGAMNTGGAFSTGGAMSTGGAFSTGGAMSTGGAFSTGGAMSTGGAFSTGGAMSTGGVLNPGKLGSMIEKNNFRLPQTVPEMYHTLMRLNPKAWDMHQETAAQILGAPRSPMYPMLDVQNPITGKKSYEKILNHKTSAEAAKHLELLHDQGVGGSFFKAIKHTMKNAANNAMNFFKNANKHKDKIKNAIAKAQSTAQQAQQFIEPVFAAAQQAGKIHSDIKSGANPISSVIKGATQLLQDRASAGGIDSSHAMKGLDVINQAHSIASKAHTEASQLLNKVQGSSSEAAQKANKAIQLASSLVKGSPFEEHLSNASDRLQNTHQSLQQHLQNAKGKMDLAKQIIGDSRIKTQPTTSVHNQLEEQNPISGVQLLSNQIETT